MALIKCAECGKEISDKAEKCVHCGCPIALSKAMCPNCGFERNQEDQECPKCGIIYGKFKAVAAKERTPEITKKARLTNAPKEAAAVTKKKRNLGLYLLPIVVVLIAANLFYGTFSDPSKSTKSSTGVSNSPLDSSVSQVKTYLKRNLKDPNSLDIIEWSPVQSVEGGYMVRCKYRAKNSLGGYVISNQVFILDENGNVISVTDY